VEVKDIAVMATQELVDQRHQFFTRCLNSLKRQLPRPYRSIPSAEKLAKEGSGPSWAIIYEPMHRVYFEWTFSKSGFRVNLHFETNNNKRNQELLKRFRPIKKRLEANIGSSLTLDDNWERHGEVWTRLYASRAEKRMTPELERWAVEKTKLLIEQCEPLLKDVESSQQTQVPGDQNFFGELPKDESYVEGAVAKVLVNRYERDAKARAVCLAKFGWTCTICRFNFEERYGDIGYGFIHVHHLQPLALRKKQYRLDPITDLVPVCPNCHAMLHSADPPLSIDELREIWLQNGSV
jgi:predicted HNH restriction endonuclease